MVQEWMLAIDQTIYTSQRHSDALHWLGDKPLQLVWELQELQSAENHHASFQVLDLPFGSRHNHSWT